MIDIQTHFVFPTHAVSPAGPLPADGERWSLNTSDGARLSGIHFPPGDPGSVVELILGFGGNGWNGQDVAEYLHNLYPAAHVVAFHYRGYRPSTGTPSAAALIDDSPLIFDLAVKRLKPGKVFAAGFSIGSGIAAQLSAKRDLDGMLLVTPFDSLKSVAQSFYPWLPIAPFFHHEIDAASALVGSKTAVAILAGANDEIVATERTDALRKQTPNLVFDRTIAGAGHNDIYARSDFQQAMKEALIALGG